MRLRKFHLCLTALSALSSFAQAAPNIIFVLTDDLGYGDIYTLHQKLRDNGQGGGIAGDGIINGAEEPFIHTPNIDRMAAEGATLTRHYTSAPVCAPARGSLLQGRDQGHANIRDNDFDKVISDNHTLGTVLKEAGYYTACVGKWGVGGNTPTSAGRPNARGFDYFYGYIRHIHGHQHYPGNGGTIIEQTTPVTSGLNSAYTTDLFTAKAKQIIQDRTANHPDTPFFLYLAYDAPHAQLQVPTQAYPTGSGTSGGLTWPLNTNSGTNNSYIHPDYSGLSNAAARHATMVRRIDDGMGDLLQTLRDLNIAENTLVIFTSDNGTHNEAGSGGSIAHDPRNFDSYGALEGIKRDTWEGGIRMPTFAWWPTRIGDNNPATPGLNSTRPSAFWDWMPTLVDVADLTPPAWSSGVSLLPELTGTGTQKDKGYLYFEYISSPGLNTTPNYSDFPVHGGATRGQMQAIFLDDSDGTRYKGIRYNVANHSQDFLIYDVDADPGEANNLAGSKTALQQKMKVKVLQVRVDGDYPRSYMTGELAPPATPAATVNGLKYKAYTGTWNWVPETAYLTPVATGTATHLDLGKRTQEDNVLLEFTGYVSLPVDGSYTFQMTTDSTVGTNASGGMLWIHDAHIIDDDFNHTGSSRSGNMRLKAGLHPIRILYKHGTGSHDLNLKYSGPGISLQDVPISALFYEGSPALTAADDSATTLIDQSVLIDVLANDSDDGLPAPISIQSVGTPDFGSAAIESGEIRYTPPSGFEGTATFTYTITDGDGLDSADVTVDVVAQQPPNAVDDQAATTGSLSGSGSPVTIPVIANDSDPDGGPSPLFITSVGEPIGGSVTISGNDLIYTPAINFIGTDAFNYTVGDGAANSSARVLVEVGAPAPGNLTANWDFEGDLLDRISETEGTAGGSAAADGTAIAPAGSRSLNLDVSGSYLETNTQGGLGGTGSFTVLAFIQTTTTGNAAFFNYSPSAGVTGGADLRLFVQGNGDFRIEANQGAGFELSGVNLNDGATHVVAAVFNASTGDSFHDIDLYVDGTLYNVTSGTDHTINLGGGEIFMGRDHISTTSRPFVGLIDDVAVYDKALSLAELDEIATHGVIPELNLFSIWVADPAFGLPPEKRGFSTDPDGDGLANGLEAWFGTHPGEFNAGLANLTTDLTTTTFSHPQNANPPSNLAAFYQWSPNLSDWYAGDGVDGPDGGPSATFNPNTVDHTTTVTTTISEAPEQFFLRMRVTTISSSAPAGNAVAIPNDAGSDLDNDGIDLPDRPH